MMKLNLNSADFLANHWQKKPLLLRNGFANFADLIEPELLAGLAMEEAVDARIIRQVNNGWDVEHGPFEDYERFGDADWTLLVQAVNEWFPEVQELLSAFRFLPDWRVDDVMVSFATENGGVGPHLDQYDVFIIQGGGRRHWRVGERTSNLVEVCPHPDLKQLENGQFDAVIDAILEPGDVLYIPAGCPHNGIALEPSINYSVGFRAPNSAEWLAQIADQLLASELSFPRYQDPELTTASSSYQVQTQEIMQVRELLITQLQTTIGADAITRVMSQSKRPLAAAENTLSANELLSYASTDMLIGRTPGARILRSPTGGLYSNGEILPQLNERATTALLELRSEQPLAHLDHILGDRQACECLVELVQQGVLYLVQEVAEEDDS
ncbi:cupin domain-containing protein [Pseudidiomarina sp. CB1]|uniref:cupin domain-containing protein n=1 Tax=Pseudidiomarina sp. CB1 TaxID=2972484 RepID=UPI0021637523|nr:cupin domain-containing protein [Pseudidiomarina sp. CB1]